MAEKNTTGDMDNSQEKTGHALELSQAATNLAEAITSGDAQALRKAADDHATALNSQATVMAASIAQPVYTRLGDISTQVKELAIIVANARQADLNWRTEERAKRDAQSTRLYEELDKLITASEESGHRLGKLEGRMGESEDDRSDIRERLARIEAVLAKRPDEREQERQALLAAARGASGDGER